MGISVVNALSERLRVQVTRDNSVHCMEFARGIPQGEISISPASSTDTRGTRVLFKPGTDSCVVCDDIRLNCVFFRVLDPLIFKTTTEFEYDKLASRLDELAYLNAGITIKMVDKRSAAARLISCANKSF